MLTHRITVAFGRIEATDAEAFGIFHIDGFHAGTHSPDASEMAGVVQKVSVYDNLAAHHQGIVFFYLA